MWTVATESRNENDTVPTGDTREQHTWESHHSTGRYRAVNNRKLTHDWTSGVMPSELKRKHAGTHPLISGSTRVIHPDRSPVWGVWCEAWSRSGLAVLTGRSLQVVGDCAAACALSAYTALYSYTRYTYHNSTLKGKCHNTWIDKEHVCPSPWVSPHPLAAEEWVGPCRVWERTHEKDMFTDENPTVGKTRRPEPLSS